MASDPVERETSRAADAFTWQVEDGTDRGIWCLMIHDPPTDSRVFFATWPAGMEVSLADRWAAEAKAEHDLGRALEDLDVSWVWISAHGTPFHRNERGGVR